MLNIKPPLKGKDQARRLCSEQAMIQWSRRKIGTCPIMYRGENIVRQIGFPIVISYADNSSSYIY
jgi:hypothetical protein